MLYKDLKAYLESIGVTDETEVHFNDPYFPYSLRAVTFDDFLMVGDELRIEAPQEVDPDEGTYDY